MGPGMHKHVEWFIGRLATDPGLQTRFAEQPFAVLRELRLELTEVEIEALASLEPTAIHAFSAALDARLRKASLATESRLASDKTPTGAARDPQPKETSR